MSAGKGPFYPRRPTLRERSVTSEQFSRSGGTEECQEVLNAVMVIVSCSTTEAARLKMVGPSTRRAANFLKRLRLLILWPNAYLLDVLRSLKSAVKDLVSHGRERFASEKTRPLFRPLAEK